MSTRYLYKNTDVPIESFTSAGEPIEHEIFEGTHNYNSDNNNNEDNNENDINSNNEDDDNKSIGNNNEDSVTDDEIATQGSVYYSETNPTSYIFWRVIESSRVLELRNFLIPSQETAINQPGSTCAPVRFKFPASILPHVTFFTDPTTRSLRCVVLTSSGILYRLDLPFDSLFTKKNLLPNFYKRFKATLLQGKIPFMIHSIDFDNIIICSKDGNIIYLKHQLMPYFSNANTGALGDHTINEGIVEFIFDFLFFFSSIYCRIFILWNRLIRYMCLS